MQALTLDMTRDAPRLLAGGKIVAGVVAAVANLGAPVMLLIDPAHVEVLRGQRPALPDLEAGTGHPCPTDGHDRTECPSPTGFRDRILSPPRAALIGPES